MLEVTHLLVSHSWARWWWVTGEGRDQWELNRWTVLTLLHPPAGSQAAVAAQSLAYTKEKGRISESWTGELCWPSSIHLLALRLPQKHSSSPTQNNFWTHNAENRILLVSPQFSYYCLCSLFWFTLKACVLENPQDLEALGEVNACESTSW